MKAVISVLKSKRWTFALFLVIALLLAGTVSMAVNSFLDMNFSSEFSSFLDGKISIDDGEWQDYSPEEPVNQSFRKAVIKGKPLIDFSYITNLTISSQNVWYTIYNDQGGSVIEHHYLTPEEIYNEIVKAHGEDAVKAEYGDWDSFVSETFPQQCLQIRMPETPGYYVYELESNVMQDFFDFNKEYTLEIIYPYDTPQAELSDCFNVTISYSNGKYMQFFFTALPVVLLFVLVCFFGLFFFPIAGFILGKVDYKYLAFGGLCFFWGLFVIVHTISGYLNMWIIDTTVCMMIHELVNALFILTIILYLKSNLKQSVPRAIANVAATVYLMMTITGVVLHLTAVMDLHAFSPYIFAFTGACAILMAVLLFIEARSNTKAMWVLVSWIPLAITIIIDAVNHYVHFSNIDFYNFGLAITMIYQIVRLVFDLRTQYLETIRYQKMQKELYEAKVSVMVSQIQPHFMYNALSSIAMLCKLDPDTAHQATITFAQYLRSNMDSLKQTKPIPFEQELEHLKKYLYIEKLRFGKKLNIVYDIQTTDFVLPQLSIQPLAENAVKHGISKKRGGGTLTIATRETETAYEVIVSDDGTGFDVNEKKDDGRSHVGMENIRRRLQEMCGAEVIINSTIGEGTVATVVLPKEEQHHENTVR